MTVIQSVQEVEKLSQMIFYDSVNLPHEVVLGVDCEGIAHGWPMALLQLFFRGETYLIDLATEKSLLYYLKDVLENQYIIKIFHDFLGDCASIVQNYGIECQGVFDTQTARRHYSEILQENIICYSIGLGTLMEEFLDTKHSNKKEMQKKMKEDPSFWYQRPLSQEMVDYAVQDVNLLPDLYYYFRDLFQNLEEDYQYEQNLLTEKVIEEATICNKVAYLNKDKQTDQLEAGDHLKGIIRNIAKNVIFVGLNIGVAGCVKDKASLEYIKNNMRVYEIYDFVYTKTKNKSLVYLKLPNTYKAKLKKESKSFKKQSMKEVKPFIPKKSKALPKKNSLNTSSCSFLPKTKKAKLSPDAPFFTPSSSQIPQLMEDHFESSGDFDEEQDTKEEGDSIEETNSKEEGGSIEDSSENIIEDEPHSKACTDVEEALKKLSIECENKSKEKVFEASSRPKTSHAEEEAKHLQSSITKMSLCSKIYKSQKKLDECKKLESTPSLNLKSKNFTPSQTAGKKLSL